MASKQEALDALDEGYQKFRGGIAALPAEAYGETWLGEWNLSQVLAHMTGWYGEMTGAIQRVSRGERPTPEGVDYGDADAWNVKFAPRAKEGTAALDEWDAAYAAYRAAAASLPENQYGVDPERARPLIGNRLLQGAGIGHFEEHQPQLDEWLKSRR
ncbi:MAG: maleylpyruvate isomerase N-terminal domain-containing protein [Tepidiformaceae bacterium]